jgi:hypothetical protein
MPTADLVSRTRAILVTGVALAAMAVATPAAAEAMHAIAMHGAPAMPGDFTVMP